MVTMLSLAYTRRVKLEPREIRLSRMQLLITLIRPCLPASPNPRGAVRPWYQAQGRPSGDLRGYVRDDLTPTQPLKLVFPVTYTHY